MGEREGRRGRGGGGFLLGDEVAQLGLGMSVSSGNGVLRFVHRDQINKGAGKKYPEQVFHDDSLGGGGGWLWCRDRRLRRDLVWK